MIKVLSNYVMRSVKKNSCIYTSPVIETTALSSHARDVACWSSSTYEVHAIVRSDELIRPLIHSLAPIGSKYAVRRLQIWYSSDKPYFLMYQLELIWLMLLTEDKWSSLILLKASSLCDNLISTAIANSFYFIMSTFLVRNIHLQLSTRF